MAVASELTLEAHVQLHPSSPLQALARRVTLSRPAAMEPGSAVLRTVGDYAEIVYDSDTGYNAIDDVVLEAVLENADSAAAVIDARPYFSGSPTDDAVAIDVVAAAPAQWALIGGYGLSTEGPIVGLSALRITLVSGGPVRLRWSASSV